MLCDQIKKYNQLVIEVNSKQSQQQILSKLNDLKDPLCFILQNNGEQFLYSVLQQLFDIPHTSLQSKIVFHAANLCNLENSVAMTCLNQYFDELTLVAHFNTTIKLAAFPYYRNPFHYFYMIRPVEVLDKIMKMPFDVMNYLYQQQDYLGYKPLDYFLLYYTKDFPDCEYKTPSQFMLKIDELVQSEVDIFNMRRKIKIQYVLGSFDLTLHKQWSAKFTEFGNTVYHQQKDKSLVLKKCNDIKIAYENIEQKLQIMQSLIKLLRLSSHFNKKLFDDDFQFRKESETLKKLQVLQFVIDNKE